MVFERHKRAGPEARAVARGHAALVLRFLRLQPDLREGLAKTQFRVAARPVVEFLAGMLIGGRAFLLGQHLGGRLLEIIVLPRRLARGEAAAGNQLVDAFLHAPVLPRQRDVAPRGALDRVELAVLVAHDQLVRAVGMHERIADAELLHQAADEIHVAFAVLHAIFDRRVGGAGAVIEIGQRAIVGKHVSDDVGDGHVVEDVVVGAVGQDPQPGLQHQPVGVEMIAHTKPLRLGDNAVELALAPVDAVDGQGRVLADQLVKINVAIGAQRLKPELEKLVDPLRAVKPHNRKLVRPKRRLQNPRTPLLPRHDYHDGVPRAEPRIKLAQRQKIAN